MIVDFFLRKKNNKTKLFFFAHNYHHPCVIIDGVCSKENTLHQ